MVAVKIHSRIHTIVLNIRCSIIYLGTGDEQMQYFKRLYGIFYVAYKMLSFNLTLFCGPFIVFILLLNQVLFWRLVSVVYHMCRNVD